MMIVFALRSFPFQLRMLLIFQFTDINEKHKKNVPKKHTHRQIQSISLVQSIFTLEKNDNLIRGTRTGTASAARRVYVERRRRLQGSLKATDVGITHIYKNSKSLMFLAPRLSAVVPTKEKEK